MQSNIILALCIIIIIATASAQTIFTYTASNPSPANSNVVCPPNIPCTVYCTGIMACWSNNRLEGPDNAPLTIIVDSQHDSSTIGTNGWSFGIRSIHCMTCSSLDIIVQGPGYGEFHQSYIGVPDNGLTTVDCTGPPVTPIVSGSLSHWQAPCRSMWFFGHKGFGTLPGQVYIKDVSSIAGRIDMDGFSFHCNAHMTGPQCHGSGAFQWSPTVPSYLECATNAIAACQVTRSPTPAPTWPTMVKAPLHPGGKTIAGGGLGGPLARQEEIRELPKNELSNRNYYQINVSSIWIVIIGGLLIVNIVLIAYNCCNYGRTDVKKKLTKRGYSKVNVESEYDSEAQMIK